MKIIHLESTGSTNNEALSQLQLYTPVAVVAGQQTAGRGRGQNRWSSPAGNLYLSVADILTPGQLAGLSVRVAVHLVLFLNPLLAGERLQIKWPNDLMVEDDKAGGILVESRIKGNEATTVAGVGINLKHAPVECAAVIGDRLNIPSDRLAADIVSIVHAAMHDPLPEQLLTDLHEMSWLMPGDRIRFEESGQTVTGIFEGYDPDLTLRAVVNRRPQSLSGSMIQRIRKEKI